MSTPDDPEGRWRLRDGELVSAVCALFLLVIMFALEWYGVVGRSGPEGRSGITSARNGWHELTLTRWLVLVTVAAVLGSVALHATQRTHGTQTDTSPVVVALASLTAALLVVRVLIDLPAPGSVVDAKLGAILGLVSAIGIALGGYESMREQRARRAGVVQRRRADAQLASGAHPR